MRIVMMMMMVVVVVVVVVVVGGGGGEGGTGVQTKRSTRWRSGRQVRAACLWDKFLLGFFVNMRIVMMMMVVVVVGGGGRGEGYRPRGARGGSLGDRCVPLVCGISFCWGSLLT